MPFTLSHPAAVIPLARGRLVPSALVAGSMAPDVPSFLGLAEGLRAATHEPVGVLTVDLVLGIVLLTLFQVVWKRPLVALAPGWARRRLTGPATGFRRSMIVWVPPSVLVGGVTHVFWDAFTHRYHGFADVMPALVTTSFAGMEAYRWLQYGSGVIGIAVIAWWLYRWARREPVHPAPLPGLSGRAVLGVVGAVAAAAIAGGLLAAVLLFNQPDLPRTFHMTVASGVIGTISAGILSLTLYGVAFVLLERRGTATSGPDEPVPDEAVPDEQAPDGPVTRLEGPPAR
ncbi:DUF4184 family protein [Actinomadura sp. 9N407]|uniref:DUF4184 family protein n=1 Tax=Actinomadura sp. 9N407 TaxID=3375154 RepID=UPI0037BA4C66